VSAGQGERRRKKEEEGQAESAREER